MLRLMAATGGVRRDRAEPFEKISAHLRTTRTSRILDADVAAGRVLGRDVATLCDKPLAVFVPVAARSEFRSRVTLLPAGARIDQWPITFATASGEVRVLASVEARAADDAANDADLDWTLVSSPAAEPLAEDQAEDPEDAFPRRFAELAHDLKQPLAAIISYARGAILRSRSGGLTPADLEGVLEIIVAEAGRAAARLKRSDNNSGGST
jgi:signal transduction histidine kinase